MAGTTSIRSIQLQRLATGRILSQGLPAFQGTCVRAGTIVPSEQPALVEQRRTVC